MFSNAGQELAQNSIKIKQDDRFYSRRLLSKESSMANPSLSFYYGGGAAAAVPFMWESQPGTPKCPFKETTLPPITPPPSYYYFSPEKNPMKKNSRSDNGLLHVLFPKMSMLKKSDHVSSSSSPSSSSSSSNSSWATSNLSMFVPITSPNKKYHHRRARSRFSSRRSSSFDSRSDYEETEAIGSPTSTMWFNRIKGCYRW